MSKEKNMQPKLSLEVFRASLFQSQEKESQQQMIVTSGMKCLESLEKQNQDGLLEKMLKALLISTKAWYSDRCLMTWKTKVSKANVLLFQLQASVRGIKGNESGSSPITYPTPTAMDHIDRKGMRPSRAATNRKTGYLSEMIKMYPTPVVSDHLHNQSESIENWTKRAKEKKKQGINLHFALRHHVQMYPTPTQDSASERTKKYSQGGMPLLMAVKMFPTPTASDMEGGAAKDVQIQNGHFFRENKKGVRWGVKLRDAIEMYPTPVSRDYKDAAYNITWKESRDQKSSMPRQVLKDNKPGGKLNPNFVELLMGYPMNWTKIDPTE